MNFLEYADEELMMMALADRIAGDLDNVQQTQEVGGRSNGAAEPAADCLPRLGDPPPC